MFQITNPDSQILTPAFSGSGMSNLTLIKQNISIYFDIPSPALVIKSKKLPLLVEVHYDFTNKLRMSYVALLFPTV